MKNVFAITSNVKQLNAAYDQLKERQKVKRSSGILVYGTEGTGKSEAVLHLKLFNSTEDCLIPYIRATRMMTGRALLEEIVSELGEAPAWKATDIQTQIVRILRERPRPIIVDEMDYLFRDSNIEILRDILDLAEVPIILVGMAQAEKKLMRLPHFYDRLSAVLEFHLLNREDVRAIADQVCEVKLDDTAINWIREKSGGKLRKITTIFYLAERVARANSLKEVTASHLQNGGKSNGK